MPASGPVQTHRLHLPSLAVELPDGWSVSEAVAIAPPSGTAIRVQLSQAAEDWDSSSLADKMEDAARAAVTGLGVVTASSIPLPGGRVGHQRHFDFEHDGEASIGRIVCLVEGGLALTVTASWLAGDDEGDREVDAALASIRMLSRPVTTFPSAADPQPKVPSVKRLPVETSGWADLRGGRLDPGSPTVEVGEVTYWSPQELAVCATILGAATFPTVGPELLGSLPTEVLNATLETVTRSLMARGLARPGDDGWTTLSDGLREIIEVAVFPDLTIAVERLDAAGTEHWWFGVRPDCGVQVTVLPDGSREFGAIDPGRVLQQIVGVTEAGRAMKSEASPGPDPDSVNLADLAAGASRVAAIVRVNTAWRVGDMIRGGLFSWALGVEGSLWLAEPDTTGATPCWTLTPIDLEGLRFELLDHLPGAAESLPS